MYRPNHTPLLLWLIALAGCSASEPVKERPVLDAGRDASDADTHDVTPDTDASEAADGMSDAEDEGDVVAEVMPDGFADVDSDASDGGEDAWAELGPGVWVRPARPAPGETLQIRYEGALASASSVTAHFGYNGWNEVPGTGATGQDDGTSNLDFFLELPLTQDGSRHVGQVELPAEARAIHMVFHADQGGIEQWDNHGDRDYNLGIRFPYMGPFLTWLPTASPSEHVEVHFHTGLSCQAYVEYGSGTLGTSTPAGNGFMHHVVLDGLSPGTEYDYRVGCEGLAPSETFSFRTADANATSVTFAFAADAQDNGETGRWSEVAAAIEAHQPSPSFIVFPGDLPWNDKPGLWWTFFDYAGGVLHRLPMVVAPGNHDTPTVNSDPDTSTFCWVFGLDGSAGHELTRVLKWGPAGFVLMNTETPTEFAVGTGAQNLWAQQTLETLDSPWVFAVMHIPPYDVGARHLSQQGDFRDLTQWFDGAVDWALSGHEHLYQRMKPMRYNGIIAPSGAYGRGDSDGVGYLIAPPAGAWPETELVAWDDGKAYYRDRLAFPVPVPQQDTVPSEHGFVIISVDGSEFSLRTYGQGTPSAPLPVHVVDEISYVR